MERFLKRIHASLYFSNKKWIYIHMCMNFYVLNFGLLDFHSDSLIFIRTPWFEKSNAERYLKRLGNAEKILKTFIVSKAIILTVFETIRNYREKWKRCLYKAYVLTLFEIIWNLRDNFANKVPKACILIVFGSIWNCLDHF